MNDDAQGKRDVARLKSHLVSNLKLGLSYAYLVCVVLSVLVIVGLGLKSLDNQSFRKPTKEFFAEASASFQDDSHLNYSKELFIEDIDGDGAMADGLRHMGIYVWLAPEFMDKYGLKDHTRVMDDEMRDAATAALFPDRELAFIVCSRNYDLEQEWRLKNKHEIEASRQLRYNLARVASFFIATALFWLARGMWQDVNSKGSPFGDSEHRKVKIMTWETFRTMLIAVLGLLFLAYALFAPLIWPLL